MRQQHSALAIPPFALYESAKRRKSKRLPVSGAVDPGSVVLPVGKSGARPDGVGGEVGRIAVEIDAVGVDERHGLLEEERGKIVQVGDRFGDVETMVGHV